VSHAFPFRSLRYRLLAPIIATALLAAVVVSVASYQWGSRWAADDLESRFDAIRSTLADSSFPLNAMVLDSLAELTQTELVGITERGGITHSTIDVDTATLWSDLNANHDDPSVDAPKVIRSRDAQTRYRWFTFATEEGKNRQDRVARVAVLFNEAGIEASRRRAALLPLVTGLSTILLLTSVTLALTSRLARRISRLQRRVDAVAGGDFLSKVSDDVDDEIGGLGVAVDSMAVQLDQLWKRVSRQEGEKLLHQIAGGLAHQLRNSMTGARMAVELHAREFGVENDESLRIALEQLDLSEDYIRRLVLVASGSREKDHPAEIHDCWHDLQRLLTPLARHLRIDLQWKNGSQSPIIDATLGRTTWGRVGDGPSWVAAISNLIHNAMQAGDQVEVELVCTANTARIRVVDNGPGIAESIAAELFEPFVTSKPEGIGLGLAVVRRTAEQLGGGVTWRRVNDHTVFEMDVALASPAIDPKSESATPQESGMIGHSARES